jgi:rhomboid protease GluP
MEPEPIPPPLDPEVAVPVSYQPLIGARNPLLQGKGFLRAGSGRLRFTGQGVGARSGQPDEVSFAAAEIQNVAVIGRMVRFALPPAFAAPRPKPFVFYCRTAAAAAAAAALLPRHFDPDFVAARAYHARLRRLSGSGLTVTNVIIGINAAVFVVMAGFLGAGWFEAPVKPYILYGANNGAATTDGEWWRLVTSMFMHYGLMHLLFNMWALFQAGQLVERLLGRALFALTYLACGLAGGLLSIYWHGDRMWSVGASGAIFGVYGALLGHFLREHRGIPKVVFHPIMRSTLFFAGYNLVYGMVNSSIDNSAHIGGFLTGIVLGWLTAMPPDAARRASEWWAKAAQAFAVTALVIGVGVWKAPRFDYSPRDEIAWSEATEGMDAGELALAERQNAVVAQWDRTKSNSADTANLIDREVIPFYQRYGARMAAATLTPGRAIDRNRRIEVQALAVKVEGLKHLSLAVRRNDAGELVAFNAAQAESGRLLSTLQPTR